MEHHFHRILSRFRPGFGLLRSLRGALPPQTPFDVESTKPDLIHIQSQSQDDASKINPSALQSQIAENLEARQEDHVDASTTKSTLSRYNIENSETPRPQFTEGASRFVLAKDGSRDCVALLVNENFLAELRDLFQGDHDLNALHGPLNRAEMDLAIIERSVEERQDALERAKTEQEADKCYETMEQQKIKLHKTRQWKYELENERARVEGHLDLSRSHIKCVLETAMTEADLIGPEKPQPALLLRGEQLDDSEDTVKVHEYVVPGRTPTESVVSDQEEVHISEEVTQQREAFEYFIDRSQRLDTIQADFEDQRQNYHKNLTEYLQDFETGATTMTRSAFDRRSVQYGQQLTRALINIEEQFEDARSQALALGALPSDYGHEFYYGAVYEESWPANKIADYLASEDWTFVESWLDGIPDSFSSSSSSPDDAVEIDEWEAEEVEVNDSISVIDYEDYRRDIDRYRRMCARLDDPCPEVRWLGQMDGRVLERRGSCWM